MAKPKTVKACKRNYRVELKRTYRSLLESYGKLFGLNIVYARDLDKEEWDEQVAVCFIGEFYMDNSCSDAGEVGVIYLRDDLTFHTVEKWADADDHLDEDVWCEVSVQDILHAITTVTPLGAYKDSEEWEELRDHYAETR